MRRRPAHLSTAASCLESHGALLLDVARNSLEQSLNRQSSRLDRRHLVGSHPWLLELGAAFVTLHEGERLRGCVGSVTATRPLYDDVHQNAEAAALRDPRFPPVAGTELPRIEIEVSVLTATEPLDCASEREALEVLKCGVDGLLLTYGSHRATLLPQVWESIPEPRRFLACLKQKAGLDPDFWHADVRLERYGILAWSEADPHAAPGNSSV